MNKEHLRTIYGNTFVTDNLAQLMEHSSDEEIEMLLEMIVHYTAEFQRIATDFPEGDIASVLYAVYDFADGHKETPPDDKPIRCKKGCSHCCNIQVTMTPAEATIIQEWCAENNIPISYGQLKKQRDLQADTHAKSEHRQCVFLKNHECSIYKVRPFACRNYFVVSEPKFCDATTYTKHIITAFVNYKKEVFQCAFMNYLHGKGYSIKQDSLARTFLSLRKQQTTI